MRCALSFDDETPLYQQDVAAWGELQALSEDPGYKESDIKSDSDKEYLRGYKVACDDFLTQIENLLEEQEISKSAYEFLASCTLAGIAMQLFTILDAQEVEEEAPEKE